MPLTRQCMLLDNLDQVLQAPLTKALPAWKKGSTELGLTFTIHKKVPASKAVLRARAMLPNRPGGVGPIAQAAPQIGVREYFRKALGPGSRERASRPCACERFWTVAS